MSLYTSQAKIKMPKMYSTVQDTNWYLYYFFLIFLNLQQPITYIVCFQRKQLNIYGMVSIQRTANFGIWVAKDLFYIFNIDSVGNRVWNCNRTTRPQTPINIYDPEL